MAFKNLNAFGAGELTPELYERGNLEKFRTGLQSLRNTTVTKMGGLRSRAGGLMLHSTKDGDQAKFLYIQSRNYLFEFTNGNLRLYTDFDPLYNTFASMTDTDLSLYTVMDDVSTIHFTHGNQYLYVFRDTYEAIRIDIDLIFTSPSTAVTHMRENIAPPNPWNGVAFTFYTAGTTAPTGYDIDYAVTFVREGVETFIESFDQTRKKPVNTGEFNKIETTIIKAFLPPGTPLPDELRIYQRPRDGGAYLFIGNVPNPVENATTIVFTFKDFGVTLDGTNLPPEYVSQFVSDTKTPGVTPGTYTYPIIGKTGLVYQDRLVFSGSALDNRVFGSRTGITAMTRDFPLQADSAVSFKVGSDGGLRINRFFDGRGLLIFTSVGVYETQSNLLTPDTAFGIKRGPYVADDGIAPLQLGGNVTIYDRRLKSVIGLTPTGNDGDYGYSEFSIFSAHLLKGKRIVSWALQNADTMILWIVLDDGKVLSFSYQDEQLVRSWARHDLQDGLAEEVFVMDLEDGNDVVCFSVNRGGTRYVERLTDRDAEFLDFIGTDSSVFYKENIMVTAVIEVATVAPVVPTEWDGPLTITPSTSAFVNVPGDVIRIYVDTYEYIDMTVTANTLGVLTVTPNAEFPSASAVISLEQGLWTTYTTLTGLGHLEGKKVSVRLDGFTHASPLNTDKGFEEYTVTGGEITLADGAYGAVISVGLPIVNDIQTLEIDTVEQSPTKLEGQIVNKLWLSYFESLFLYAAAAYPEDDTVTGMESQEYQTEPDEGILFTQPTLPMSERLEMQIQGDWKERGSVALRNVDPQPIALRAIIPDTEVVRY